MKVFTIFDCQQIIGVVLFRVTSTVTFMLAFTLALMTASTFTEAQYLQAPPPIEVQFEGFDTFEEIGGQSLISESRIKRASEEDNRMRETRRSSASSDSEFASPEFISPLREDSGVFPKENPPANNAFLNHSTDLREKSNFLPGALGADARYVLFRDGHQNGTFLSLNLKALWRLDEDLKKLGVEARLGSVSSSGSQSVQFRRQGLYFSASTELQNGLRNSPFHLGVGLGIVKLDYASRGKPSSNTSTILPGATIDLRWDVISHKEYTLFSFGSLEGAKSGDRKYVGAGFGFGGTWNFY